jgi:imidazolonepropionase-like amidohydrolase
MMTPTRTPAVDVARRGTVPGVTRTVFHGGRVFDGTGAPPSDADVLMDAGRIVEVGPGLDGDEGVDCAGMTVLPGLFDCHVHLAVTDISAQRFQQTPFSFRFYEAMSNMTATLAAGVTTVRDAAGADLGMKTAVEKGLVPGPRMQISITMLSQTGGHGDDWEVCGAHVPSFFVPYPGVPHPIVDGPDEMRRRVRELVRAGADVIKIATSGGVLSARDDPRHGHFRDAELAVLAEEAAAAGRFVMAHAQATDGIKAAIRNGIRSIEHGIYLDDEAIGMMLDRGTYLVPTLVAPRGVLEARDRGIPVPQVMIDKTLMVMDTHAASIKAAIAAGVRIAMGTDSGVVPHGQNLRELDLMVDCGLSAADALVATTKSAAELMGLDEELGTLEPGKRADVVLVEGDALDGLSGRVRRVWKDGIQVV